MLWASQMTPEDFEKMHQLIENSNQLSFGYQFVIILVSMVTGMLLNFGTSYLKKKGENHATKKDIAEITQQIESVKTENQKELEEFKFQIIQKIDKEKEHFNEGVNQLLLFHDTCSDFYFNFLTNPFLWGPYQDANKYDDTKEALRLQIINVMKRYQRLSIYFDLESNLLEVTRIMVAAAIQTNDILNLRYEDIVENYLRWYQNIPVSPGEDNEENQIAFAEANLRFWEDMTPIVESASEGYQNLKEQINEYLRSHISHDVSPENTPRTTSENASP